MSTLDDAINEAVGAGEIIKVDFSGLKDLTEFGPLPEGDYVCRVVHAESGTSAAGNPKAVFRFEVAEGDHKGRVLFRHIALVGSSLNMLRGLLSALGLKDEAEAGEFNTANTIGKMCVLHVKVDANDPRYNDVRYAKPYKAPNPLT